ncbi:GNAT family N-acetyltransferase [Sphingomonas sp. QA11]|uniref:GNAT family N-acetyltransferase n=1 Tax=Sphingomonas sp. QA11 TaxID=2950605 RepID=UPI00234C01AA|nr:GNAT family N-acetyltransferase [Sphingomonas sp. QA11]WCM28415.1 GNAT family N-acetyltransferase [Sphingomonas sp. QA11]
MLAPAFADHGVEAVMVRSTLAIPSAEAASFVPANFSNVLPWHDDIAQTLVALRDLHVDHVIAGSERGVMLADRLSEALGLAGNGTLLSEARRDKARMIEEAGARGVRVPRQIQSGRLHDIMAWIDKGGQWPVVLKPRWSKGSEGVYLCASREEVSRAFHAVHDHVDQMGFRNDTILVQEFLAGREFVIDTVSHDGRHRLAALWVYGKPVPGFESIGLLSTKELLPSDGPLADMLFAFAVQVLGALEIRHGAGHCEVIVDAEGPALVEIGARLHGGPPAHLMCRAAIGTSQLDLLVQSCVDPSGFLDSLSSRYRLAGGAMMALLRDAALKGEIETLPSARSVVWNERGGDPPPAVAGLATLIHPERQVVADDLSIVTGELSCEILGQRGAVEAMAPEWRALLGRSRCNRAFGGPTWYLAALDAWPDLSPLVIVARRGASIAGVFPLAWHRKDEKAGFATVLSDYNDLVVADGDIAAARRLMIFARHRLPHLDLTCIRADSNCATADGREPVLVEKKFICPIADLSAGYDGWFAARSPGFRRELALATRRAARNGVRACRLDPVRDAAIDPGAFFLEMQQARFGERSLFLRDPAARNFVTAALPALWREGTAPLFGLWVGKQLIGLNICMLGADSLGNWNAGFLSAFATFSPGMLMADAAVREACAMGLAEFDYLRGIETYKLRWCSGRREIGRLE